MWSYATELLLEFCSSMASYTIHPHARKRSIIERTRETLEKSAAVTALT